MLITRRKCSPLCRLYGTPLPAAAVVLYRPWGLPRLPLLYHAAPVASPWGVIGKPNFETDAFEKCATHSRRALASRYTAITLYIAGGVGLDLGDLML